MAENMPDSITLQDFYFQRAKIELRGTAVTEDQDAVGKFNEDLRHVANPNQPDQPLFSDSCAAAAEHPRRGHGLEIQLHTQGGWQ